MVPPDIEASTRARATDAEDSLSRRIRDVFAARAEVLEAYLFGSQATGMARAHSDVDVAVYVDPGALRAAAGYGYQARLTADLMSALGRNDVDLLVLNLAPPLLYHRVLRDGCRVLSRDLRATTTREGQALSRYCDDLPRLAAVERVLGSGRG
jgi:hypothetical protein